MMAATQQLTASANRVAGASPAGGDNVDYGTEEAVNQIRGLDSPSRPTSA